MNKKNLKKKKAIALSQIFILTISILAFAYFVGDEFKLVGALDSAHEAMLTSNVDTAAPNLAFEEAAKNLIPSSAVTPVRYHQATAAEKALYFAQQEVENLPVSPGVGGITTVPTTGEAEYVATQAQQALMQAKFWTGVKSIIGNAVIAAGLYFGGKALAEALGADSPVAESLGKWMSLGYGAGALAGAIFPSTTIWAPTWAGGFLSVSWLGLVGLGIGLGIWLFTAKEDRIDAVQFTCSTWQPKSKGLDCEQCNKGQFPCSPYKCKSLGNCEFIINEKTGENLCVWKDRNDLNPPIISSWSGPLREGYSYNPVSASLPADSTGTSTVTIEYSLGSPDKCIPPFKIVTFGISLNKPSKCKMDLVRKNNFADMKYDISFGDSLYNHTLTAFSPGLVEAEKEGIPIPNGGKYEVFVRCESRNGVSNVGTFAFKFCVQSQPDTTAASVVLTEPLNGMPISTGTASQEVSFYIDKPANCKWSHNDEDYNTMSNAMTCAQSITEMGANMLYKCSTTLSGLKNEVENKFYVKCKSYPAIAEAGTINSESYVYKLIGTKELIIDSIEPVDESTIKDSTEVVKVTLKAQTSAGYKEGKAWCYYNEDSNPTSKYVMFANTDSYQHSQELWLDKGKHTYSIKCCDLGGNCKIESTDFTVETDNIPPLVVRLYNEGQELKIVTNEEGKCVYDIIGCSYNFEDGIALTTTDNRAHFTAWDTKSSFYIKCRDKYGNGPANDKCSIIAHPFTSI